MEVSNSEKLILFMLSEIYKKLDIDGEIDPDFIQSAIYNEQLWGLKWKYPSLLSGVETPQIVTDVCDILDMWSLIESSYEQLSSADKKTVDESHFGAKPEFLGFDGNNETEYMSISAFLVNDLERFSSFKGRGDKNSHSHKIDLYQRMYKVFKPMRNDLVDCGLSAPQIISILSA